MDTAIAGGDFAVGANGIPRAVSGAEELLQRAAIRLRVPLGSFRYCPALGSRLHTLGPGEGGARAISCAQEALKALPQIRVESASVEGHPRRAEVAVSWPGGSAVLRIPLEEPGIADAVGKAVQNGGL